MRTLPQSMDVRKAVAQHLLDNVQKRLDSPFILARLKRLADHLREDIADGDTLCFRATCRRFAPRLWLIKLEAMADGDDVLLKHVLQFEAEQRHERNERRRLSMPPPPPLPRHRAVRLQPRQWLRHVRQASSSTGDDDD